MVDPDKVQRRRERALNRDRIAKLWRQMDKPDSDIDLALRSLLSKPLPLDLGDLDVISLQDAGFLLTANDWTGFVQEFKNTSPEPTDSKAFIEFIVRATMQMYIEISKARNTDNDGYAPQYEKLLAWMDNPTADNLTSVEGFIAEQDRRASHRELFTAANFFTDPANKRLLNTYVYAGVKIPIPPTIWHKAQTYYKDWNGTEPLPDVNVKKATNRAVIRVDNIGVDLAQLNDIINQKSQPIDLEGMPCHGKDNPFLKIVFERDGKKYQIGSSMEGGAFKVHAYYEDENGDLIEDDFKGWLDHPVTEPTDPSGMSVTDAVADACLRLAFFKNAPAPIPEPEPEPVPVPPPPAPDTPPPEAPLPEVPPPVPDTLSPDDSPPDVEPPDEPHPLVPDRVEREIARSEFLKAEPAKGQAQTLEKNPEGQTPTPTPFKLGGFELPPMRDKEPPPPPEPDTVLFIVEHLPGIVNLLQKAAIESSAGKKPIEVQGGAGSRSENMVNDLVINEEKTPPTYYALEENGRFVIFDPQRKCMGVGKEAKNRILPEGEGVPLYCEHLPSLANDKSSGTFSAEDTKMKGLVQGGKEFRILKNFILGLNQDFKNLAPEVGKDRTEQFEALFRERLRVLSSGNPDQKQVAMRIAQATAPRTPGADKVAALKDQMAAGTNNAGPSSGPGPQPRP